jgi:Leucine-rich repeat (LRR) protein
MALQALSLRRCRLPQLPYCVGKCSALRSLDAGDNAIAEVPDFVLCMEHLTRLDLTNNNISKLPPRLGFMSYLRALLLDGNPLRVPRRAVVERGTAHLLEYLRDTA